MKLTEEQMKAIMRDDDAGFEYEKIEQSEWEDQGKFQSCEVIFECEGKFYSFSPTRWGSHWQGYETEFYDDEAVEVEKKEVVTYAWVAVNPPKTDTSPMEVPCCEIDDDDEEDGA